MSINAKLVINEIGISKTKELKPIKTNIETKTLTILFDNFESLIIYSAAIKIIVKPIRPKASRTRKIFRK